MWQLGKHTTNTFARFEAVNVAMRAVVCVCAGNCMATALRGLVIQLKLTAPKVLPRCRAIGVGAVGADAVDY